MAIPQARAARLVVLGLGTATLLSLSFGAHLAASTARQPSFAALIARLSEPGGDFDTDNLVSNERSYLQVVPAVGQAGIGDGAYVGVGPDQNFSYIAQLRPRIAFIIDVRRDNLLLHLLFKAVFGLARTRADYLSLLTGRPIPVGVDAWSHASIEKVVAYVDETPATAESAKRARTEADECIKRFGVRLSMADFETIDRFHRAFIDAGLSLRFESRGRSPRSYYPTYRELLLATDQTGQPASYLSSERRFRFVQSLERRGLVIPVVGDIAGPHAMTEIGRVLTERHEHLSAMYVSNIEDYLFRDGRFPRFVENLDRLSRDARSVVIRSIFRGPYGLAVAGPSPSEGSASVLQSVDQLVADFTRGRYQNYSDVVNRSAGQ